MRLFRALTGSGIVRTVAAAAMFWLLALEARAAETILRYHADIIVESDGTLDVTETIRVRAEGRSIRRGIYRDFPTRYREPSGLIRTAGFELVNVHRDGKPEPHHTKSIAAGIRIYAGHADVLLRPGEYTYRFQYRTTRQLRYFDDHDEIYWNVTGNFWRFPIERASARIVLPEGAGVVNYVAYTGRIGSRASDAIGSTEGVNKVNFETTRRLGVGEGLTVAVAFPKGFVPVPSSVSRFFRKLIDNFGFVALVLGFISVAGYFAWAWRRFGIDPPKGTVIPLFHPPQGLTPAAVSYLFYKGFKKRRGVSKAFLAALVQLAVDRRINILDVDGLITIERGPKPDGAMGPGERRIFKKLLGSRQSITFNKTNGKTVASALSKFDSAVENTYGNGRYFSRNIGWFIIGPILSFVSLVGFLVLSTPDEAVIATIFPVMMFGVLGVTLLSMGLRRFRGSVPGGSIIVGILVFILGAVITVPVFAVSLFALDGVPAIAPIVTFAFAVINIVFFHLMPSPTERGRQLMDEIEGFRMYLQTAESERMNLVGAPEISLELFERFLPHAVALDAEQPWSDAYEAHVARVLPQQKGTYQPHWYSGSRWNSGNIGRSTSAVASAVSSGMASAVPSSSGGSSGFSGGGGSGGGGGGGGGGGW